jgi:putative transposase
MARISFKRHRFPADVIRHAVWLYFRFTLSFRDVEELLAQRGIAVSYETVRCWTIKFGPQIAKKLQRRRAPPSPRWHLDEMVCTIGGERVFLWRAVDDEGEVLDLVVQKRRNTRAALKLLNRLLRNQGVKPETIATDFAKTTVPKTHISRSEDASARCSGSSPCLPRNASSPRTRQSTTRSISSAT